MDSPTQIEDPWFCDSSRGKGAGRSARGQALSGGPGGPARTALRPFPFMIDHRTWDPRGLGTRGAPILLLLRAEVHTRMNKESGNPRSRFYPQRIVRRIADGDPGK